MPHTPVLLQTVLEYLNLPTGARVIDATVNGGGHAIAIEERIGPQGKVLGIDRDSGIIAKARERFLSLRIHNVEIVQGSFADIAAIAEREKFVPADAVLFDLGFSSYHVDESGKGFSFERDEPLDMRYDMAQGLTAEMIVNTWPEGDLEQILREYGEERWAKRIARALGKARERGPIRTTRELADCIRSALPLRYLGGRIHPATRTFQAIRIAVNDELVHIHKGITGALLTLRSGGRVAVISFHSLEDRIVKSTFRTLAQEGVLRVLTKKPAVPLVGEIQKNPRARSAKLRVAEKL